MPSQSVLPARRAHEVQFEISAAAAEAIRHRGGRLWIWPSPDRSAYATREPPGDPHEWTVYREGELVVRVDDAIVAPQRWAVALAIKEGRHLGAWWNGNDPAGAFGRLPLVDPTQEEPTATRRWSDLVLGGFALLGSVVWVLGIAGVHRWWFDDVRFVWLGVSLLIALLAVALSRLWRRVHRV